MRPTSHRVLLAGMASEEALPYCSVLEGMGFETAVIPDIDHATAMLEDERFGAVVVGQPLKPGALGGLMTVLRGRGSLNASAGLVLLSPPESLRGAASLVGRGVTRALSRAEDPVVLAVVVERILELGSVTVERMPIRLEVTTVPERPAWHTEDVSGFGMLVAAPSSPPIGADLRFALALPDEPIHGLLRVVRLATTDRDGIDGFGARFLSFDGDGQQQLRVFLRSVHGPLGSVDASPG